MVVEKQKTYRDLVIDTPANFSVHSRVYKDPQIFEDEIHAIFEKTWVYLCHESELPQSGDYLTVQLGTASVIITRDEAMRVNVLINTCRHRANAVCRYDYGNSQNFRCPYHGWVFKNSGELIGVADRRRYPSEYTPEYTKEHLSLIKVPHVGTYRGLIFGCLDKDVPYSLDEYLGETKKYIDLWADRSLEGDPQLHRPHLYSYNGNWKFQSENSNDGYHVGFTHQSGRATGEHFGLVDPDSIFRKVSQGGIARGFPFGHGTLEGAGGGSGHGRSNGAFGPSPRAAQTVSQHQVYWDALVKRHGEERAEQILHSRHLLIFPNVILFPYLVRVVQPVAPDETIVASHIFGLGGVPEEVNMATLDDVQHRLSTTGSFAPDDVEMFAANQTGLRAKDMEWLILNRGLGKETMVSPGEWYGVGSDETPMRAIYKEWARLMGNYESGK